MSYLHLIARRVFASALLVVLVVSISWLLTTAAPGRRAMTTAGGLLADEAQVVSDAEATGGLLSWWRAAASLDFGTSTRYHRPVGPLVAARAVNSAMLASAALVLALAVGLPLGLISFRAGPVPHAIRLCSVFLLSCPPIVTAIVLTWVAVRSGWRIANSGGDLSGLSGALDIARAMALPSLSLAIPLAAVFERLQSRALARVAGEPWIAALAARGLSRSDVRRHVWWAALPPVASVGGTIAGALLGGALSVEVITSWPGLGRLTFDALLARDTALVAGCAAVTTVFVSVAALASDLIVAWADPRGRDAS